MDALSDVLRIVRLTGAVFMDAEFTAPWCVGEPSGVEVCIEHLPHAQHQMERLQAHFILQSLA